MAQLPPPTGPPEDSGPRKSALPQPDESSGKLQRHVPMWDAARRLRDKKSSRKGDLPSGDDPLSEKELFDEELEDLNLSGAKPEASGRAVSSSSPIGPAKIKPEPRVLGAQGSRGGSTPPDGSAPDDLPVSARSVSVPRRIPESGLQRHYRGEAKQEADWMGSQVLSLWWVLAGALCIVVLWVFLSGSFNIPVKPTLLEEPERLTMNDDLSDVPIADFVARADEILPEVADLLEKVNSAEGPELAKLIRGGEESRLRRLAWLEREPVPTRHHPLTTRQLHAASARKHAYLIMVGQDLEWLRAVAYFTKEGDSFKYDWEASEGYSEILPSETDQLTGEESKLMRCIILPSNFYTPGFPEEEFQGYTLHHSDPGEFVWAFALRSSEGNKGIVSHFSGPVFQGTEGRVTIRVRKGPEGARSNQVEIVEFVHGDWFTPTVTPEP
ncbi:MAG: hypothetical protein GY872_19825 [Roseibacillus sp.]|nr:hypothetical protein [Roseibacillus sp.]